MIFLLSSSTLLVIVSSIQLPAIKEFFHRKHSGRYECCEWGPMGMAAAWNGGPLPIKRFLGRLKSDGILPTAPMGAMGTAEMAEVAGRLEQ